MKPLDREVVRDRAKQRLALLPRERRALEAAAAGIDEDFDMQTVVDAFNAFDEARLNSTRALERNFEIIHNYLVEIIRCGLILEGVVEPSQESGAKRDFRSAARLGVISHAQVDVLDRLHDIRSGMQHLYPDMVGQDVHEGVTTMLRELPALERALSSRIDRAS